MRVFAFQFWPEDSSESKLIPETVQAQEIYVSTMNEDGTQTVIVGPTSWIQKIRGTGKFKHLLEVLDDAEKTELVVDLDAL